MKLTLAIVVVSVLILAGCADDSHSRMAGAPSGDDCAENIAYLQDGVDAYREAVGSYPSDVNQLLDSAEGQGPFVESIPACPAGNIYKIENGVVREAPRG